MRLAMCTVERKPPDEQIQGVDSVSRAICLWALRTPPTPPPLRVPAQKMCTVERAQTDACSARQRSASQSTISPILSAKGPVIDFLQEVLEQVLRMNSYRM